MASAFAFPSQSNGFVAESSGLVCAFIRREDEFPLSRYVQYINTPKTVGLYCRVGRDEPARIVRDESYAFADGDERPRGDAHKVPFQTVEFATFRRDYPWTLGDLAIEQATIWKPKLVHMAAAVSKAMTNRTNRVISLAQTAANWPTGMTATANSLNGGAGGWATASDDQSSPNYLAIHKSIAAAARAIFLQTNGKVTVKHLKLIVSPDTALKMGQSAEMLNYVRETSGPGGSREILEEGLDPAVNELWGCPRRYKGLCEIVVENTPIVTEYNTYASASSTVAGTLTEATTNRTFCMSNASAVLVARQASIDGEYGSPSWGTLDVMHYGGLLQVKMFNDARNERVDGHVEENIKEILTWGYSGFLITGV